MKPKGLGDKIESFTKATGIKKVVDGISQGLNIPCGCIPCMTAGLAYYLSQKKAPERMQALKLIYEDEWRRAADQDGSRTSLYLTPQAYFPSVG